MLGVETAVVSEAAAVASIQGSFLRVKAVQQLEETIVQLEKWFSQGDAHSTHRQELMGGAGWEGKWELGTVVSDAVGMEGVE